LTKKTKWVKCTMCGGTGVSNVDPKKKCAMCEGAKGWNEEING